MLMVNTEVVEEIFKPLVNRDMTEKVCTTCLSLASTKLTPNSNIDITKIRPYGRVSDNFPNELFGLCCQYFIQFFCKFESQ